MRQNRLILFLVALTILLVGCTQTTIISEPISQETPTQTTTQTTTTNHTTTQTEEVQPTVTDKIATSCKDTDAGVDFTSRGTISGTWADGTTFENKDDCFGFVYLVEYYCDNGQPRSQNSRCANGCSNGVCL